MNSKEELFNPAQPPSNVTNHTFFQQPKPVEKDLEDRPKCITGFLESLQFKDSYEGFISQKEFLKVALSRILCTKNGPDILLNFIRSPFDNVNQKALMDAFNGLTVSSLMGVYIPQSLEAPLTGALTHYLKNKSSENLKTFSEYYKSSVNTSVMDVADELTRLPANITTHMYYSPLIAEINTLIAKNETLSALEYFKTLITLICDDEFFLLCSNPLSARGMRTTEHKITLDTKDYYLDFNQTPVGNGQVFSDVVSCCEALLTQIFSSEKISRNIASTFDSLCYFGWLNPLLTQMIYIEEPGKTILYPSMDKPFFEYMTLECLQASDTIFSITYPASRYSAEFAFFILQQFKEDPTEAQNEYPDIEFKDIPQGFYLDQNFVEDETSAIKLFFSQSRMRQMEKLEQSAAPVASSLGY